ncbi:MAG: ATP-dependent RecD-like DNA helicase [Ruminococcus sp.]|nr:ATP-dependent RecD-like DNA helicase [Ruminococcus sp.]
MEKLEKIKGEVDSIIYRNDENGFAVIMLACDDELITVVGELGNVEEGEELVCTGELTVHKKFGEQFKCSLCERSLPKTKSAIQRYLASGVISGIGTVLAKRIVAKFGDESLEVIESDPERLVEIEGITIKKAKKMSAEFKQTFAVRSLMIYLSSFDIPVSIGVRAWKRWGDSAESMIKTNPYVMCRYGVELPFIKADTIARNIGIEQTAKCRIEAGIDCVLKQNASTGHTCLPLDRLEETTCKFLGINHAQFDEVLNEQLEEENLFKYYKKNRPFIMLRDYYKAEDYISRRLEIMSAVAFDNRIDFSAVIDIAEEENNITYEDKQRQAINLALSKGFLILTGGPGTGKTTTLNAIISLYEQQGMQVMIAAPTGRAAKRISDLTGYDAKTIHRLLEVKHVDNDVLSFVHDENNMLDCDVTIIDEMSMVDSCLFEALLRALSVNCKLVLVGDTDQLPSVGAGNVLKDIIDSGVMPVVTLTEIFRQAKESAIVTNAHKIVKGEHIDLTEKDRDFFFFQRQDFHDIQDLVVDLCKRRLPDAFGYSPFDNIQVLSPARKGPSGTVELNRILQNTLNPAAKGKSEIKTPLYTYRKGDKVMQTKNDYEIVWKKSDGENTENGTGVFNGDIGVITNVNKILQTVTIDFEGRVANYSLPMLDNLELAYAVTVHKSQGSEFDAVILTLFGGYDKLYYRNLLYTAVTRAKRLLIIIGTKTRVEYMIDNNRRTRRYTCLKNMLMESGNDDKEQDL